MKDKEPPFHPADRRVWVLTHLGGLLLIGGGAYLLFSRISPALGSFSLIFGVALIGAEWMGRQNQ